MYPNGYSNWDESEEEKLIRLRCYSEFKLLIKRNDFKYHCWDRFLNLSIKFNSFNIFKYLIKNRRCKVNISLLTYAVELDRIKFVKFMILVKKINFRCNKDELIKIAIDKRFREISEFLIELYGDKIPEEVLIRIIDKC